MVKREYREQQRDCWRRNCSCRRLSSKRRYKETVLVKNWKPKTEPKAEVVTEEAPEPPVEEPEEEEPTSEEPETEEVKEEAPVEEPKAEEPC